MQSNHTMMSLGFLMVAVIFISITTTSAMPLSYDERIPTIDELVQMLRKSYDVQSKRGLDLGFERGYSGKMAAKYLTGLELAGPMGPGRKRRSDELKYEMDPLRLSFLESAKRGLDLGFGRGFSGIQTARHLIGLEEANDAMGPGRRRRSAATTGPNSGGADADVHF